MPDYGVEGQKQLVFSSTSLVYPRKLDTALRATTVEQFLKRFNKGHAQLKYTDKVLITGAQKHWKISPDCSIPNDNMYPKLLNYILNSTNQKVADKDWVYSCMDKSLTNMNLQVNAMAESSLEREKAFLKAQMRRWQTKMSFKRDELMNLGAAIKETQALVDYLPSLQGISRKLDIDTKIDKASSRGYWRSSLFGWEVIWSGHLCIIKLSGNYYLLPQEYILLIYNKLCDLFSVLICALAVDGSTYEAGAYNLTMDMITEMILIAIDLKQKFFPFIKILEAIIAGMTLPEVDTWPNDSFFKDICRTLSDEEGINPIFTGVYTILKRASIPFRHELGCLSKIVGHPFVNIAAGARQLHQRTTEHLPIDDLEVQRCKWNCTRSFIKNHIVREKRWPLVILDNGAHPVLVRAMLENRDPEALAYNRLAPGNPLQLHHYEAINLEPIKEFDYIENFIPQLRDRTISVSKSKVLSIYVKQESVRTQWKETRLLLYFLMTTSEVTNHVEYIKDFEADPDYCLNYFVIRVVPKEKELKEKFRGFGCKTYMDRARTVVQEKNVKHFLNLYSDEQAMTLSELEITKRLFAFRRIQTAYPRYVPLYLVIDSTGWNNKFRHESVHPIMEATLDKLYNSKVFSKTMMMYEKSLVYIPDESGCYYWDGQLGGIEGLNQDTWVVCYIAQIRTALRDVGHRFHLFCKGDDMRVVILIPEEQLEHEGIGDIKDRVVGRISEVALSFGHTINVNESYGSHRYFAFSKAASVGTIELPQVFRKIQKVYGANNAFLTTLDDYIAASFSNAHGACRVSGTSASLYLTALVWSLYYVSEHPAYKDLPDDALSALMLIPSMMGGFPTIYFHNMFVRAESDLLSPFFHILLYAERECPRLAIYMKYFTFQRTLTPKRGFKGFLSDSYSLPIDKPTLPSTVLRKKIIPAMKGIIRNETVKELFELSEEGLNGKLETILYEANVYNGKVFSALYAASPDGLVQELSRKFESGRSIMELLLLRWGRYDTERIFKSVSRAEHTLQNYRASILRDGGVYPISFLPSDYKQMCGMEIAQRIRDTLWGKHVEGISMPPLQHQLRLLDPGDPNKTQWDKWNHFQYTYSLPTEYVDRHNLPCFATSHKRPFLGYTTRSGLVEPSIVFIEKDVTLSKLKNLIDLISWTRTEQTLPTGEVLVGNLDRLIYVMMRLYTPVEPELITPFAGARKSGTIQHHVRSPSFKDSIVPNSLSNLYQCIVGESNTHHTYRHSPDHYKVNFLHILCYAVNVITLRFNFCNIQFHYDHTIWGVTTECAYCTTAITETPIIINLEELNTWRIRTIQYTTIGRKALNIVLQSLDLREKEFMTRRHDQGELPEEAAAAGILQSFMDSTFYSHQRLADCYTQHSLSEDAYKILIDLSNKSGARDVGVSELQRINMPILANALVCIILYFIRTTYQTVVSDTINIVLSERPETEHPWYTVLCRIHSIGRMGVLIRHVARMAHLTPPPCFESPPAATLFLGVCAVHIGEYWNYQPPIVVYLSSYEVSDFRRHILPKINAEKHRWSRLELEQILHNTARQHDSIGPHTALTMRLLACLWLQPEWSEEVIEGMRLNLAANELHVVPLINFDQIIEEGTDLWTDPEEWTLDFLRVVRRFPDLGWVEVLQDILGHLDALRAQLWSFHEYGMIQWTFTDLATCIQVIRSTPMVIDDDMRRHLQDQMPALTDDIDLWRMEPDENRIFVRLTPITIDAPILDPFVSIDTQAKILLHESAAFRHQGFVTASCNKFKDVMRSFGIRAFDPHLNFAAVCDGHGGFAASLASMTTYSTIVFNTLIRDARVEVHPEAAVEVCQSTHCTLQYPALQVGMSDFSDPDVARETMRTVGALAVMTSDAETRNMDLVKKAELMAVIGSTFLTYRTMNGALLAKIYADEQDILLRLIAFLAPWVLACYIIKPESSGINNELYIVFQGKRATYGLGITSVLPYAYPAAATQRHIGRWLSNFSRRFRAIIETRNERQVFVDRALVSEQGALLYAPSYFECRAGSELSLSLPKGELERRLRTETIPMVMEVIKGRALHAYEQLWRVSDNPLRAVMKHPSREVWDSATYAHQKAIASKSLVLAGFTYALNLAEDRYIMIRESELRKDFVMTIYKLPRRLGLLPVTGRSFRYCPAGEFPHWTPYACYIRGARLALSLIGYCWTKKRETHVWRYPQPDPDAQ
nr:MAG: RNA-dependent RNA polymerase [Wufeng shrew chuvirus 1]